MYDILTPTGKAYIYALMKPLIAPPASIPDLSLQPSATYFLEEQHFNLTVSATGDVGVAIGLVPQPQWYTFDGAGAFTYTAPNAFLENANIANSYDSTRLVAGGIKCWYTGTELNRSGQFCGATLTNRDIFNSGISTDWSSDGTFVNHRSAKVVPNDKGVVVCYKPTDSRDHDYVKTNVLGGSNEPNNPSYSWGALGAYFFGGTPGETIGFTVRLLFEALPEQSVLSTVRTTPSPADLKGMETATTIMENRNQVGIIQESDFSQSPHSEVRL